MADQHPQTRRPLVVDLDSSLIKTDLLWETLNQLVSRRPYRIPEVITWLLGSRIQLKNKLSAEIEIDPAALPINQEVLGLIREAKAEGRPVILATASPRVWAEAVADELGYFDRVFASSAEVNLKKSAKREALVEAYGEHGFDYVADNVDDLEVWRSAAEAYPVTKSQKLIRRIEAQTPIAKILSPNKDYGIINALWAALRAHQWVKNLLVLLPLFTAHLYSSSTAVIQSLIAFAAFSLTASAAYLINDLVDVWNDRHHPSKQYRPIASGNLEIIQAWVAWVVLLLAAVALCFLLPLSFAFVLIAYFVLTLWYSFYLKQKPIVDGLFLGLLYTLRIVAGSAAIGVPLSFWLLAFAIFFFMSLALLKRYSELLETTNLVEDGQLRGRGYRRTDLPLVQMIGVASGIASTLILALFVHDQNTIDQYRTPQLLWVIVPLIIFWICRAWLKGHRGIMLDDPVVWALKDYASWILIGLIALSFVMARWLTITRTGLNGLELNWPG